MPSFLRFLMAMTSIFWGNCGLLLDCKAEIEFGGGGRNRPTPLFFGDSPQFLYTNTFSNWFGIL